MRQYAQRNGPATRQEILNTLRHNPGMTKSQLCRMLDLSWGTISHHVRRLLASDELVTRPLLGSRRLFLTEALVGDLLPTQLARQPALAALLCHVAEEPGIGIQTLANALSIDRRIVRRQLNLLIVHGLVAQTRRYRPQFFVIEQTRARQIIELSGTTCPPHRSSSDDRQ